MTNISHGQLDDMPSDTDRIETADREGEVARQMAISLQAAQQEAAQKVCADLRRTK
jgi:hypothetical protein